MSAPRRMIRFIEASTCLCLALQPTAAHAQLPPKLADR